MNITGDLAQAVQAFPNLIIFILFSLLAYEVLQYHLIEKKREDKEREERREKELFRF
jgi:hypothetical protein